MSLVGFHARNRRQQTGRRGANPDVDDRGTPLDVFTELAARFGGFSIDVAAAEHNTKCERFYSVDDDGLAQSWAGERVWCNPPYSDIGPWVEKAHAEADRAELIVMLLPANRTEQGWWQDHVEQARHEGIVRTEFLRGRIRFHKKGQTETKPNERPPFGCVLLIWQAEQSPETIPQDALPFEEVPA